MARRLKPQKVAEVESEVLGITVPIYLDRNTLGFYAHYPPVADGKENRLDAIDADSADEVKRLVLARIRETSAPDWKAVIAIKPLAPFGRHGYGQDGAPFVGFEYERFEVATVADRRLRRRWPDGDDYERKERAKNPLASAVRDYESTDEVRLPYTESAWSGVGLLQERIRQAHRDFAAILKRADINAVLEVVAMGLPRLLGQRVQDVLGCHACEGGECAVHMTAGK